MDFISKIRFFNFKAFNSETEINLDGSHLLMYGENGSGKSSIYWGLYTLMQSSTKNQVDVQKYFTPNNKEHLINYQLVENLSTIDPLTNDKIIPQSIGLNSFVEIELKDGNSFKIDSQGLTTNNDPINLQNLNKFSDFISHRLLINFYNFRNSKKINLWEVFVRDIFPFVNNQKGNGAITLSQFLKELESNKPFKLHDDGRFTLSRSTALQNEYHSRMRNFNADISHWIGEINTLVNTFYAKHFQSIHNDSIKISLVYSEELQFDNGTSQFFENGGRKYHRWFTYVGFNSPKIDLKIETLNTDGSYTEMSRPQSYFNEAKLTSIALSIRFSLLHNNIRPPFKGQFIALDDLLVSMDMSNRDKVLDILLDEYSSKYKIYLFTHEKSFFDFCVFKIEQRKKKNDWKIMEIHSGETSADKPVIIPTWGNSYEKALMYFDAKDYTTCSLYLRKELEKLVIERLPVEYTKTIDGQFHNLEHYWKLFVERFKRLNIEVSPEIKDYFKQSKLLILNPAAHHNLNLPVYKLELERAFKLVRDIYDNYPIPKLDIILSKGMTLVFKHPTENYHFEFELESDLSTSRINNEIEISMPKNKVIIWQFKGVDLWDFSKNRIVNYDVVNSPIIHNLDKIIKTHINFIPLDISIEIFLENTTIKYGSTSLSEMLLNNDIQLYYNFLKQEIESH